MPIMRTYFIPCLILMMRNAHSRTNTVYKCLIRLPLIISLSIVANKSPIDELTLFIRNDEIVHNERSVFVEEAKFNGNLMFVSLGAHCQTAVQLNHYGLRNGAFPFDWLLSDSTDGLCELLFNDFQNFFDEHYLFSSPNAFWWLENPLYKFEFRHEWPYSDAIFNQEKIRGMIAAAAAKYARRIKRFKNLRQFQGRVVFIRTASSLDPDYYWRDPVSYSAITQLQSQKLRDALRHFFPDLNFDLIIINYSEKMDDSINLWGNNIFELKVANRNTHAFDFFKHVFEFLEKLTQKSLNQLCIAIN